MRLLEILIQNIDNYLNDCSKQYIKDKKRVRWSNVVREGFTYSSADYDRTIIQLFIPRNVSMNEEEIDDAYLDFIPLKRCQTVDVLVENQQINE